MTEINFHLGDCMDFMRGKPDNYYDLAVVDPPYGGGGSGDSPFPAAQAGSEGSSTATAQPNAEIPPPKRNPMRTKGRFAKYERRELPPPDRLRENRRNLGGQILPEACFGAGQAAGRRTTELPPRRTARRNPPQATSSSGTSLHRRNTSTSFSGYRRTR
jgi:hypothetical protein